MKRALVLMALLVLPAWGAQLTDEELAHCAEQGGCALVTRVWLMERLKEAEREGRKACSV